MYFLIAHKATFFISNQSECIGKYNTKIRNRVQCSLHSDRNEVSKYICISY